MQSKTIKMHNNNRLVLTKFRIFFKTKNYHEISTILAILKNYS